MKKLYLIILGSLFAASCQTVTTKPIRSTTTTEEATWKTIKKPADNLKAVAICSFKCNNGTDIKGKAVIKISKNRAVIKIYASAGVYAGKITISSKGIYASENIAPFATYIRDINQVKSAVTGFIYNKNYIVLSSYLIEIPYGKMRELYFYKSGSFDKVVIENSTCHLTIKPLKVKEEM